MSNPEQALRDFIPSKEFFIGIDSDGCVFDSMEIKHQECFAPMFIKHFGLQSVSKYAREVWIFTNLYSKTRGCNRFHALILALEMLSNREDVKSRDAVIPSHPALNAWVENENKLGNTALDAEVARGNDLLMPIQSWSNAVNAAVKDIVHGVPPFPLVRDTLVEANNQADCFVISQTPTEALEREWSENNLIEFVHLIAGQEMGTKTEHLSLAAKDKYAPDKILMIGDAPGDYNAAKAVNALFFPIIPGSEEASWKQLHNEGLAKFFSGKYSGDYQEKLLNKFEASLPEKPNWNN